MSQEMSCDMHFTRMIQLAREGVVTFTEVIYLFLELVFLHPSDVALLYQHFPANLVPNLQSLVKLPSDEWRKHVTWDVAAADELHCTLRRFFEQEAAAVGSGPLVNFPDITKPVTPCPYCGEPLRTPAAKQCRFCKMDWHDPNNVHYRCRYLTT